MRDGCAIFARRSTQRRTQTSSSRWRRRSRRGSTAAVGVRGIETRGNHHNFVRQNCFLSHNLAIQVQKRCLFMFITLYIKGDWDREKSRGLCASAVFMIRRMHQCRVLHRSDHSRACVCEGESESERVRDRKRECESHSRMLRR